MHSRGSDINGSRSCVTPPSYIEATTVRLLHQVGESPLVLLVVVFVSVSLLFCGYSCGLHPPRLMVRVLFHLELVLGIERVVFFRVIVVVSLSSAVLMRLRVGSRCLRAGSRFFTAFGASSRCCIECC